MTAQRPPTALIRVSRRPNRARYDRETVWSILDEGLICHLGFVVDVR
jgi:nitroimidazol reductase NimA-like FMN-containing flavoprotein (pyridoxamine 5'-phosphate oxidase superfamily)